MKTTENAVRDRKGFARLTLVIVLIFAVMGASIWAVSKKTSDDMADAAILNLNENLNLVESTVEAIQDSEAQFQRLLATELAAAGDPAAAVERLGKSDAAALISVVPEGADVGVSNDGAPFDPASLDFSGGGAIKGLPVSQAYVNAEGSWAYTVKCPIERDGVPIAELYTEYTFDAIDQSLPQGFYGQRAVLYLMDAATERFVLKPEGMGERDAGHVNLEDFYRANNITDPVILSMVADGVANRENVMFAHKVKGTEALCYLWSIGDGTTYLVGYVPMEAIQREAQAVNVALIMVASITIAAFCLCVILYGFNRRKQARARRAREEERALHAEQLAQALRAAEVANESKSAFLANMSHDIRTPMNAVLGFTTIIEKEADNPAKVRDCAGKIMASGRHLLDLINDVLDISKIESGKASLTLAEFDLGDSLAAVESIIAPMARDKGQTFCAEIRSVRHERLIGDETHLNQILLNLLSNAVKYTPEGGRIWLRFIGLPAHSNALEHLRIEVEDDGYGMTPEFLKTIFDSFTRAENSTTNKVQGTGLGMSITKSLVDLMGGTIEVESEVGKGSLFRVDLELRIPEEQAAGYFWERAGIKGMLVADASPAAHGAIAEFMEGTGVEVDGAASADAACELARARGGYDVVLVGVPWLDDAAVRAADGLRASAETPLLFMLEHAFDQDDDVALPPGAAVLTKPFFPSMLKQKIEAVRGVDAEGDDDLAQVLSGKHFLAAEDNFLNAGILTDLLEMEGATVEIVENGKLAVERFERCEPGEFDAILMDVQMPVMNGHAAAQAIRALARADAATIPIFAMTADAFVEDEKAALAAGMNAHVAKPLEIDELRRAVDRFVEKGRS
ncbi:ATP-binding protein [Adlercreutzia sp.]|jgi:signal transduction histidine kinase/CheY-like chemotaxis protein|uniref:hybrid sensor histidine kinase/response regulator n=1 Tax=Adlercreutzia sp. TaxID=1872387 RepID=UPI000DF7E20C|nr:ATP-binding protein [Adlercreutzia sp.]MEE0635537.1 ATP-binding protein [Adlercreutzia sp.]RDC46482.1 hybrid sensor histidine kinase/response regulator [Adlercreutzia equolifaciens subsp. celatus]